MGLSFSCLSLLSACIAFISRRGFITSVLFAALFAFLSCEYKRSENRIEYIIFIYFLVVFIIIGVTVFAVESVIYVDRLKINNNINPRRWGMWLLIPNLILSFFTSICFIIASILNWCDYRSMQVTGIFSHSGDKLNDSVCKVPSERFDF
jgi:heme/copper-type cytochrome/quinol oxidase subunit 2